MHDERAMVVLWAKVPHIVSEKATCGELVVLGECEIACAHLDGCLHRLTSTVVS